MAADRSSRRNVAILDASNNYQLGGLAVFDNNITNKDFYRMIRILVVADENYLVLDASKNELPRNDTPLTAGSYYISSKGEIKVTDEKFLVRTVSKDSGTRIASFRDQVRDRDQACVISGLRAFHFYLGFTAAHLFPLSHEEHWIANDFSQWITIPPPEVTDGTINSVQNGLLLSSSVHGLFNSYLIAIDVDAGYKVICFQRNDFVVPGKILDSDWIKRPDRAVDPLLRWHFRQCVLVNMRGAGEPIFEHDFPPGSDQMQEILEGPRAAEVMEAELFRRFNSQRLDK